METSSGDRSYIHSDAGTEPIPYSFTLEDNMHTLNLETLSAPFRAIYTSAQASSAAARLILKFGEDGGAADDPDRDSRRLLIAILSFIGGDTQ